MIPLCPLCINKWHTLKSCGQLGYKKRSTESNCKFQSHWNQSLTVDDFFTQLFLSTFSEGKHLQHMFLQLQTFFLDLFSIFSEDIQD